MNVVLVPNFASLQASLSLLYLQSSDVHSHFLFAHRFIRVAHLVEHPVRDVTLVRATPLLPHLVWVDDDESLVIRLLNRICLDKLVQTGRLVPVILPQHVPELGEHGTNVTLVLTQPLVNLGADEILEHLPLRLLRDCGDFSVAFFLKLRLHRRANPVVPLFPRRRSLLSIPLLLVVAPIVLDLVQRHLAGDCGRHPRAGDTPAAHHRPEHVVDHRRGLAARY
mmetsp:Transcript_9427/g.36692  ORF Transcript_9427/g.36692 Transcript_9427/m.36692 type:complete len:223 (+) Transcript_9427:1067-1735(+)